MRKKLLIIGIIAVILAAAFVVVGWASGGNTGADPGDAAETKAAKVVYGKIKEINGNEMLLAIGTAQEQQGGPGGNASGGGTPQGGGASETSESAASSGAAPQGEGQRGQHQGGMGQGGQGRMSAASIELTGEEVTYLIPVTCPITSGMGENVQTVRFTQLAVKNVVKLSLDENGRLIAVQVLS